MKKNLMMYLLAVTLLLLLGAVEASADIKMRTKTTIAGRTTESTTYIKGQRERSSQNFGGGFELVTIRQCDLKQTVQINDNARTYMVMSNVGNESSAASAPSGRPAVNQQRTRRGGVVTYTSTITDTGERKKFSGFTARRIKTSMITESSPDACSPVNMKTESDGWYIDLDFSFNCGSDRPPMPLSLSPEVARPECQDEIQFKRLGSGKLGYPVFVVNTIFFNGQASTTTTEVVELSTEPLDASLFEVPSGYTEAKNYQDLIGMPSLSSLTQQAGKYTSPPPKRPTGETGEKQPGTIRVGVVSISNRAERSASLASLRDKLISEITGLNIDAVPLAEGSQSAVDAEAKSKGCDYVLYTEITGLKKSGKVGGLLGKATGVGGLKERVESRLDFRLFSVGNPSPLLNSSASAKEEGNEDVSLAAAASQEAKTVVSEVRKRR